MGGVEKRIPPLSHLNHLLYGEVSGSTVRLGATDSATSADELALDEDVSRSVSKRPRRECPEPNDRTGGRGRQLRSGQEPAEDSGVET